MKVKKALLFMIVFMIGMLLVNDKSVQGEEDSTGVSLSPAYLDLGSITGETKSFALTVVNKGNTVSLKAKVDNADNIKVTVAPDEFTLSKNEQKEVVVTLHNDDTMKIGMYDLSFTFLTETDGKQSIKAYGTNASRVKFRMEGMALATCNVKDIAPLQKDPFHSILCNFYEKSKTVNVTIDITKKGSSELVWQQSDTITMESYPVTGYYGQIDTPLPSKPWEYGDYIYHLVAMEEDDILLTYQTEFNVGERKGELVSVSTRDVRKGEPAVFHSVIKNIGTQDLPVIVQIYVKDRRDNIIYEETKSDILFMDNVKEISFEWPTMNTKMGRYSIDYSILIGDQQETGILYYNVSMPFFVWWIIIVCILLIILVLILILVRIQRGFRKLR
ncbi:MAG: hypothetical protein K0S47_2076 [Herbinix sp.]|jgi:hypothetical protein|nr:hypothetical protein [Herbinix sp.]